MGKIESQKESVVIYLTKKNYEFSPVLYTVERCYGKNTVKQLITESISKENSGNYRPLLTTRSSVMYNIDGSVGKDMNANR